MAGGLEGRVNTEGPFGIRSVWLEWAGIRLAHGTVRWVARHFSTSLRQGERYSDPRYGQIRGVDANNIRRHWVDGDMAREELTAASRVLDQAAETAEDPGVVERLETQAAELAALVGREQGPDHGGLARRQQILRDIKQEAPETAELIDEANEHINGYRETLEGV